MKRRNLYFMFIFVLMFVFAGCTAIPKIISPKKDRTLNMLDPTFNWKFPNKTKTEFEMKIAEDPEFTRNVRKFVTDKKGIKFTIPYLKPGNKYYWIVRAFYEDPKKGTVTSAWSYSNKKKKTPYSFRVDKDARGVFGLDVGQEEEKAITSISENITQLTFHEKNDWSPAVSHDGTSFSFCSDRDTGNEGKLVEIYVGKLKGRVGTGKMKRSFSKSGIKNLGSFWLNDNENVCYFSNRFTENLDIYNLFNSTRSKAVGYINDGMKYEADGMGYLEKGTLLSGSCSEDNKIVYSVKPQFSSEHSIYMHDRKNNSYTSLMSGLFPHIMKNRIVYSVPKSKKDWNIWVVDLEGSEIFHEVQLTTEDDVKDYDPSFSPDGKKIAFASDRKANADIWVMNSDGTHPTQLTSHPMPDRCPAWIDNTTIVFQSKRGKDKNGNYQWDVFKLNLPEDVK